MKSALTLLTAAGAILLSSCSSVTETVKKDGIVGGSYSKFRARAIDTPVCTGKPGKATPPGVFPVKEKIADKRSNIFGSTYYKGRKVHGGDRRKYRGPKDKYIGAPLPYWMRMTGGGIGMHGSNYVHRVPRSNGCVRTPPPIIDDIYRKMTTGSKIEVVRR